MTATAPDLLRALLLKLDALQRSPPEPILLIPGEIANQLSVETGAVVRAIAILSDLDLIEGPGEYADGWLFRQLTQRGRRMTEEVATARQWRRIKRLYGGGQAD